jgi:hypothetical protein
MGTVKDDLLHIRIEKALRAKAVKKAARTKKTLTKYVCNLIEADTQPIKRSRRETPRRRPRYPPLRSE